MLADAALCPFNLSLWDTERTEAHLAPENGVSLVFISILIIPHLFNRGSISIPKLCGALIEIMSPELSFYKRGGKKEERKKWEAPEKLQGLCLESSGTVTEWGRV